MREAAKAAGSGETLERYARDYPVGPHDQPQSMCPAFGALRVGLRMRRTASVLCGSACCVYGLTFTSHFYGAKRTVGYVPFNSETLVTGKLFEDIRDAVFALADPDRYDAIVVINLCVPTASGVPLRLLPQGDRRRARDRHRRAGLRRADPCRGQGRARRRDAELRPPRGRAGPGAGAARAPRPERPSVTLLGEMFPADPVQIGGMLDLMGLAAGPVVPTREWRELYGALDCAAVAAIHPFYTASVREFELAGRPVVGSAPVGVDGTAAWLEAIGAACGVAADRIDAAKAKLLPAIQAALAATPIAGRITLSGYEGSELHRRAAHGRERRRRPLCRHRLPEDALLDATTANGSRPSGVEVKFRASLEDDYAALAEYEPDLAIGTTPVVQKAKERAIPALYFTNLISARPLMGVAGASSLAKVVNAALASKSRFDAMRDFFEGVGAGHAAGVWETVPRDRPEFKAKRRAKAAKPPVEEMGSC